MKKDEQVGNLEDINNYFLIKDIPVEDIGGGVTRQILAYNDNLMVVKVNFEKGSIGNLHKHQHEQISYILSGEFEFNIDGKKMVRKFYNQVSHLKK